MTTTTTTNKEENKTVVKATIEDTMGALTTKLKGKDWFHSLEKEIHYGRSDIMVYVTKMTADVFKEVPIEMNGYRLYPRFSADKTFALEVTDLTKTTIPVITKEEAESVEELAENLDDLDASLWAMKKVCGKENLMSVFEEIHDAKNAKSKKAEEYPEVFAQLKELYDEFGYDILFEKISV